MGCLPRNGSRAPTRFGPHDGAARSALFSLQTPPARLPDCVVGATGRGREPGPLSTATRGPAPRRTQTAPGSNPSGAPRRTAPFMSKGRAREAFRARTEFLARPTLKKSPKAPCGGVFQVAARRPGEGLGQIKRRPRNELRRAQHCARPSHWPRPSPGLRLNQAAPLRPDPRAAEPLAGPLPRPPR